MFNKENKFCMKASTVCAPHSECWNMVSKQSFRGHQVVYSCMNSVRSGTFGKKLKVFKFPEGFLMAFTFVHLFSSASLMVLNV